MNRIYLDEASEAPLLPEARDAMLEWIGRPADPSRVYSEAIAARRAIEEAREAVAALCGASPRDVTFTSSATEALNWVVTSAGGDSSAIAMSSVEHSAVFESAKRLQAERQAQVAVIDADAHGAVQLDSLAELLDGSSGPLAGFIQHANHETGTVQPVAKASELCHEHGASIAVDAALTVGRIPTTLDSTGADVLVISAHKFGGPPGTGAVVTRRGFRLRPFILGGNQERARRGGPENVAAIVGFGVAAAAVRSDIEAEAARQASLTASLREGLKGALDGIEFLGDQDSRLPHLVSLQVAGVQGEAVVLALDQSGFAVHSGSACSNEILEPSRILQEIGVESRENLRISIGRSTPDNFMDTLLPELVRTITALRQLAG